MQSQKVYLFILLYCCIRTARHFQKQENSIQYILRTSPTFTYNVKKENVTHPALANSRC